LEKTAAPTAMGLTVGAGSGRTVRRDSPGKTTKRKEKGSEVVSGRAFGQQKTTSAPFPSSCPPICQVRDNQETILSLEDPTRKTPMSDVQKFLFDDEEMARRVRVPKIETEGIKYAGSKREIVPYILDVVKPLEVGTIFDAFPGSTRVGSG
jgi:hypothetical protein